MGISEKAKSLYCGVPGGGAFEFEFDSDGRAYLPLKAIPYELEDIFAQWADQLPDTEKADLCHLVDGVPVGIAVAVWDGFISWMLATLREAQA